MQIIRDWRACPESARGAVLALGNFDGLHLGHRAVIEAMLKLSREEKRPAALMTFEPHPRRLFAPQLPPLRIIPFHEKARLLREMGVEYLFVQRFTRAFSEIRAQAFLHTLLLEGIGVSHIVTGDDFIFGHQREGNGEYLAAEAARTGSFAFHRLPGVSVNGERCSSTAIRRYLEQGDMLHAACLLGRPYEISGKVRQGQQRGRTIGFPTANMLPVKLFLPARGVYAVRALVEGAWQEGVANLGVRPSFQGEEMRLEVHLFTSPGDIYGKKLRVQLLHFLRPERKFDTIAELTAQIAQDAQQAREFLAQQKERV